MVENKNRIDPGEESNSIVQNVLSQNHKLQQRCWSASGRKPR